MTEIQFDNGSKLESETGECSSELKLANEESTKVDSSEEVSRLALEFEAIAVDQEAKILELDRKVEKIKLEKDGKVEIPTLVVEIFLKWLKDVELLKTCRLVNQYWNDLACSSLRNHSIVKLDADSLHGFRKCKRSRARTRNGVAVPRPFKNFHVSICGSTNDTFYDLARRNKNVITSLKVSEISGEARNREKLNKFFKAVTEDLSTLHIADLTNDYLEDVLRNVKFSNLTNFNIQLSCLRQYECHTDSLINSLGNSKLQQLTLHLRVSSKSLCLTSLLQINLSHVVELNLEIVEHGKNDNFWKLLSQLKLPSLKIFKFKNDRVLNEEVQPVVIAFLSNVALTLFRLHINYVTEQPEWRVHFREVDTPN